MNESVGPQISWLYKKRVKEFWVSLWPMVYRAHSIAAFYNCMHILEFKTSPVPMHS